MGVSRILGPLKTRRQGSPQKVGEFPKMRGTLAEFIGGFRQVIQGYMGICRV